MTFDYYAETYLKIKKVELKPSTYYRYDGTIRNKIMPSFLNRNISEIKASEHFLYRDGEIYNFTPQPVRMSDFDLWSYYHEEMDMDTVNHHHFVHTRNECIKRGLTKGNELPLNIFTREYFEASVMDSYDF